MPPERACSKSLRPQEFIAWKTWLIAAACFVLPLLPLIAFNLQTGGTVASISGNLGQSYYGVNNLAYWPNLVTRLGELQTLLRGDHLWYLGESYANSSRPWLAIGLIAFAVLAGSLSHARSWRCCFPWCCWP